MCTHPLISVWGNIYECSNAALDMDNSENHKGSPSTKNQILQLQVLRVTLSLIFKLLHLKDLLYFSCRGTATYKHLGNEQAQYK